MATEPIGFFPNPKKTKKDSDLEATQAKQVFRIDPQVTVFLHTVAIVLLIVAVVMLIRRLPIVVA